MDNADDADNKDCAMSSAREMLDAMPTAIGFDTDRLAAAIDAAQACAQVCTACATACLTEDEPMVSCVHSDLNCADICTTTARVLTRAAGSNPEVTRAQLQACLTACEACALACDSHADQHEHCRLCAQACHRCAEACRVLLESRSA